MPAEVKVEEIGPCKKRLKIMVPKEDLQEALNKSYDDLVQNAVLPGFRKGKVPRKLVEKRFGDDIKQDVKQKAMADAVRDALDKNKLSPVGETKFDHVEFDVEKALSFDVVFEVLPVFESPDYKGLKLNRRSAEPTDEDVYNAIQDLRRRAAILTTMEKTRAEKGDLVICDYEVHVGDQIVAAAANAEVAADGMNVIGISPEPVAELLIGAKADDKREGRMQLTNEFSREDLRGKEALVKFVVKEVKRPIMPEVDEAFAKKSGCDSVDELKDFLRERVKTQKETWVKLDLERQACEAILAATNFELPLDIVKSQAEENLRRRQIRLMLRGISHEQINREMDKLREASEEEAVRSLKTYLIIEKIAEKEKVFATEDDVQERINMMGAQRRLNPVQMKQRLEAENAMSTIRSEIRHQKVLDMLLEKAKIVDVKKSITEPDEEEEKPDKKAKPKEKKKSLIVTPEEAAREARDHERKE